MTQSDNGRSGELESERALTGSTISTNSTNIEPTQPDTFGTLIWINSCNPATVANILSGCTIAHVEVNRSADGRVDGLTLELHDRDTRSVSLLYISAGPCDSFGRQQWTVEVS